MPNARNPLSLATNAHGNPGKGRLLSTKSAPERIRTPNLLIRSQLLCPIELPAHVAERVGFEPTKELITP